MSLIVDSFNCERPIKDLGIEQDHIDFISQFEKKHDCKVHYFILNTGKKEIRLIAYLEFFNAPSYNLFALKYL